LRQIYKKSRKATKKLKNKEKREKKGRAFLRDICRGRASLVVLFVLFVVFAFFFTKHIAEFVAQPFLSQTPIFSHGKIIACARILTKCTCMLPHCLNLTWRTFLSSSDVPPDPPPKHKQNDNNDDEKLKSRDFV
jgi:hypothetical protein